MKKVLMAFVFCLLFSVSVQAKDVLPTNTTTASKGCTLVGVEGKYITDAQNVLRRINEIRYEACEEGVPDPRDKSGNTKLTIADYKEIKWSYDLEYIARIRAAEASVVLGHARPNGESSLTQSTITSPNKERSWGENITFDYEEKMLSGVNVWYTEKDAWVNQTAGAVTGHYTAMINPNFNYVGIGTFVNPNTVYQSDSGYKCITAGEFSYKENLDETKNEMEGECIQTIEVKDEYLSLKLNLEQTDIEAGESVQANASMLVTNPSSIKKGTTCKVIPMEDIIWSSSDEQVATVDKNGKITGIDCGSATITAKSGALSQTVTIKVTTHDWDEGKVTTEPTCEGEGVKTYICKVCNAVKTESIPATGHKERVIREKREPTCETAGYTGNTYCAICNKLLEEGKEIPAIGHKWDEGKVTTEPTCEGEGVKTYICKVCNATKTESIPATGHKERVIREKKEATCETAGYTGNTYCAICNKLLEKGKEIPAIGHRWDEGKITTEPTCEADGEKTYTCKVCNATTTEGVPATGHQNKEVRNAVEPGCETTGYTGDVYCKDCNNELEAGKEIPATGHQWDAGKVTKAATYTETGIRTYTCKVCGTKKTEAIKKLSMPKIGTVYTIAGNQYKITKPGAEVSLVKANSTAKSINIPATIKANGLTYKVTVIASKAFKQNKKLQSVTVGANVKSISKNAFFKCSSLKKVNLKTVLLTNKTASKKAFKGVSKKLTIKAPKKVKKSYKKIFKGLKVK